MGTLRVTILGCGSSGGVPRATGDWGACDPNEPKNRRSRSGIMLQQWRAGPSDPKDATTVLIDTSPDLRLQLAEARPARIDAILFSHDHADQTHGIDDVRAYYLRQRAPIAVHMDAPTRASLTTRFGYCFAGGGQGYPALLRDAGDVRTLTPIAIDGPGGVLSVTPLEQEHGPIASFGFRAGPVAYSNDVVDMPATSFAALDGLSLWIVDALRERPHPSHAHLALTLEWIARVKPAHAVLTNLNDEVDYRALEARLPAGVEPAYDGWRGDYPI